jgi:hypothetical protein
VSRYIYISEEYYGSERVVVFPYGQKTCKNKHSRGRQGYVRTWLVRRPQPWSYSRPVADQQLARDWWSSDFWWAHIIARRRAFFRATNPELGLEPTGRGVKTPYFWRSIILEKYPEIPIISEDESSQKEEARGAAGWAHHQGARAHPWLRRPVVRPPWPTTAITPRVYHRTRKPKSRGAQR